MVQDEFLLWVKQDAPYQNVQEYLEGRRGQAGRRFPKMGGAQSKDTDETLTRLIDKAAKVKFTYIPFKSGAEAAVQLAGGHVDIHVNNPSESIGQWKGSTQRPICAFSPQRASGRTEGHGNPELARHPDLRGIRPRHSAIPAAAHRLAAGQGDARAGRRSMST